MSQIDKLLQSDILASLVAYVNGMSDLEIKIVIALIAVLILFLAYRLLGLSAVIALIAVYFFAYIILANHTFDYIKMREKNANERMKLYQNEIDISDKKQ